MNLQGIFDTAVPLQDAMNKLLRPRIGPFKANSARVVDNFGQVTQVYPTVVHEDGNESQVAVDKLAAVVDCYDVLTIESLQAGYQRILAVKSIPKTDRPDPIEGERHMTTGFVVARNSELTLEQIASEMRRLNGMNPSHYWPDVVAVLSTGVVNYSAHMPASEQSGDFFLPTEATTARSPSPSVWVQLIIRATGELTFNKVASLIIARVAVFRPGAQVSDHRKLIQDIPAHGAAIETYQFNLANTLVAMTKEQAIIAQLPQDTYNIVSGKKTLGSVQYQSWQDGGVFVVRGNFPIDLFLVFLRGIVPGLTTDLYYFRGDDVQVSYVLPVSHRQFSQTLALFERRSSNMSIQRESAKVLMQKIGDEGSTSPFVARIMIGIMETRNSAFRDSRGREHFDDLYEPVLSGLRNAREASRDLADDWKEHRRKVESGEIVNVTGRTVHISENIDRRLKRDLESFLNTAVRTIKNSFQVLVKDLGYEIGFLFQKESSFQAGISKTMTFDAVLADYLIATRQWSEPLVLTRNSLEHGTIPSPKVSYIVDSSPVRAEEPNLGGQSISEYTNEVLDRICCFIEEITIFCLRKKLPSSFEITEVPLEERDPEAPVRFHTTITPGGRPPWTLKAHTRKFDEV